MYGNAAIFTHSTYTLCSLHLIEQVVLHKLYGINPNLKLSSALVCWTNIFSNFDFELVCIYCHKWFSSDIVVACLRLFFLTKKILFELNLCAVRVYRFALLRQASSRSRHLLIFIIFRILLSINFLYLDSRFNSTPLTHNLFSSMRATKLHFKLPHLISNGLSSLKTSDDELIQISTKHSTIRLCCYPIITLDRALDVLLPFHSNCLLSVCVFSFNSNYSMSQPWLQENDLCLLVTLHLTARSLIPAWLYGVRVNSQITNTIELCAPPLRRVWWQKSTRRI